MSMITRLHYFNCVVETGSISAASRAFDVQPSSISRQLAALEAELGIRLLNRTTRNVGLTEAGSTYYHYSQRIVAELDEANRAVNDLQQSPKGNLKINMTVGFGESCVLPLVPGFMQAYPDVNIELELTERVVDIVEDNVDIAIRSGRLPDSNLIASKLANNDFLLCATPQYLAEHGRPKTPDDLRDFNCICYGFSGWRDWYLLDDKPRRLAIKEGLIVNSVNGQKQLILNHAGLALIPRWAVSQQLNKGELIHVLAEYSFSPYEKLSSTYALYLKRDLISPKIRVFLDYLKQHL
ncbi:MAG: DNA-binding transcriptional LysR family regulator [Moritella dasanensis]|jgi:DNA-binding transcriptional LysR family regulator